VVLPAPKRGRSKSKRQPPSPLSKDRGTEGGAQAGAGEEHSTRDPPKELDQVPVMVVFARILGTFAYLDCVKCAPKVIVQEKEAAPTTSQPPCKKGTKLKCIIPFSS
jgi:hypothetical protein